MTLGVSVSIFSRRVNRRAPSNRLACKPTEQRDRAFDIQPGCEDRRRTRPLQVRSGSRRPSLRPRCDPLLTPNVKSIRAVPAQMAGVTPSTSDTGQCGLSRNFRGARPGRTLLYDEFPHFLERARAAFQIHAGHGCHWHCMRSWGSLGRGFLHVAYIFAYLARITSITIACANGRAIRELGLDRATGGQGGNDKEFSAAAYASRRVSNNLVLGQIHPRL